MSNATPGEANPADPIPGLIDQFVTTYQVPRIVKGERPALRAVFRRYHGTAHGTFTVLDDLPDELRVGLFKDPKRFPVWVRFSSDTGPNDPDTGQMNGIGIKLFGVPGANLLEAGAETHDFVMQNVARFFVDDAQGMYDFTDHPDGYVKAHPETGAILGDMTAQRGSVLAIPYWSCLPSKFGDRRYAKYKLVPDDADMPPDGPVADDYLRTGLRDRLAQADVHFTFCVQLDVDDVVTPLDRATVAWSEHLSPPVPVARLSLPRQDVTARGSAEYADNLAFTAWHALPEHEPVGSLQWARRFVYAKSAETRRYANGIPNQEPRAPRPPDPPYPTDVPEA